MRLQRTVRTDKAVESVFAYLADFAIMTECDPGTVRTTRTSGEGENRTVTAHDMTEALGRL